MYTNGRTVLTSVLAMVLLVLLAFAQPALAQAQSAPVGGTVTLANATATRPAASGELGALWGPRGYGRGCYNSRHHYCHPHGRHAHHGRYGR